MKLIVWLQKLGSFGALAIAALGVAGTVLIILTHKPRHRWLALLLLLLLVISGFGWAAFWASMGRKRQWSDRRCYVVAALTFCLFGALLAGNAGFPLFVIGATGGPLVGALCRKLAYPELKFGGPPPEPPVQLHIT